VHEGGCATPFIAHWPQGISARGALRRGPAHVIDVVPTLLELAAAKRLPADAPRPPGRSLVPALGQDHPLDRDSLWWLHDGHRAIRVGDWKLVAAHGDPWELFDLSVDRAETNDLAARFPEKVKQLEAAWTRQLNACRGLAFGKPPRVSTSAAAQQSRTRPLTVNNR